jgi:hypothetical protein
VLRQASSASIVSIQLRTRGKGSSGKRTGQGEVGDGQLVAADEALAGQLRLQHRTEARQVPLRLQQLGGVGLAAREHLLEQVLPVEGADRRREVREVPRLPAHDVCPPALVARQQTGLRLLGRQVLHDRVRLPEHEVAVYQRGNFLVGVELRVLRRGEITTLEVHDDLLCLEP